MNGTKEYEANPTLWQIEANIMFAATAAERSYWQAQLSKALLEKGEQE